MRPNFRMTSHSTEPEIETCTGYWNFFGGNSEVSQEFKTNKDCFKMNDLIQRAYDQGVSNGKREAKATIAAAMSNI